MAIDERKTGQEGISSISGDNLEENEIRLRISELMEFEAQSKAILRDWIPETRLNGGAFAHVFRMRKRETRQRAALKFIPIPFKRDECVADPDVFRGEFDEQKREVELLAQFRDYPYIMQVIGEPEFLTASIQKNGQKVIRYAVLFLMPLLNAKDIWGPQIKDSMGDRLRLCIQISTALIAFNEKRIRHRDIKPENILMDEHGDFCLTDLGQAKKGNQTTTFRLRGTEGYIAPEVYRAWEREEAFDHRADIYSLGIVMYELFNWGQKPFLEKNGTLSQNSIRAYHSMQGMRRTSPPAGECANQLRYSGKIELPAPGEADSELAQIILKACAYEAKNRYKNAGVLLDALETYRGHHPEYEGRGTIRVYPVQEGPVVPERGEKKRMKPVGIVLGVLVCAGICVGVWIRPPRPPYPDHDEWERHTPVPAIERKAEPAATPTAEPTATPTVEPTATPTVEPTAEPTATPTPTPTATPTVEPTATPTAEPTATPTPTPTATPTVEPTATPTAEPTATPTVEPTAMPTAEPTPTPTPTAAPTPTPITIQSLQQEYALGGATQASMKRGQKLAVYSGPDYSYIRGAKGKASVSTNDWVDCYGLWGDWYLIEYEINNTRNRRGYINRYEINAGDSMNNSPIPNAEVKAIVSQNVSVTDDPTQSGSELVSLRQGQEVTIHFFEGAWACISFHSNSGLAQGYVPASSLALDAR